MNPASDAEHRLLLLPPTRRDAEFCHEVLARSGIPSLICANLSQLCDEAEIGAGALLVTQEAIFGSRDHRLTQLLQSQPAWSDLPLIVLTPAGAPAIADASALATVGNMQLLQRPVQVATLVSTVRFALRDRQRQYKLREHLEEQRRHAEALAESDRRKDEFLAVLAHELRNPLAPLRTGVELLMADETLVDNPVAPMMERQISHMVRLIDDLLDLSRVTQGKFNLKHERVNLADVIGSAVEATRPQIDQAGHELHLKVTSPLPVNGDVVRLTQVFANLLTNAVKYTNPGGQIHLTAIRQGDTAVVHVRDNGLGIPQHMLWRVFEMFAQVDSSLGRSRGGLGIGLTLVRQLVHMHGGQITVASDGDGQGSEFTVELPLIAEPVHRSRAGDGIARYEGPPLNVLVADDNVDAAITLSALLRRMGQSVRVVHNGRQAIDAARDQCPQLAILDIGMPIVNGYEAAVAIREQCGPTRNLYLAALTGWGQDGDRQKAMESGFDTHLVKPIDAGNVSRLLSAAAEKVL